MVPAFPEPPVREDPLPGRDFAPTDRYLLALLITVLAIVSQYFVPELLPALRPVYAHEVSALLVVYGLPIAAFALLVGVAPLRRWRANLPSSSVEGLRWYGLFSLLTLIVLFILGVLYELLDPSALALLTRPNPVLAGAASDPWFWIAFSFVIGAVEETIFRGWVFGYWLTRAPSDWKLHALWTSALFAGVHLYYGVTYLAAAPLQYSTLFLAGLGFAYAVRYSGGCLVIVALLHGADDASAFLAGTVSPVAGDALHYGLILLGLLFALIVYLREQAKLAPPSPPYFTGAPGSFDPFGTPGFPLPPPPPPGLPPTDGPTKEVMGWVDGEPPPSRRLRRGHLPTFQFLRGN
ncbi:MAG: CPBP family intramembrane metalloprotease [Thermoplasmata archaeon]|nr:CPBP family intramembrane metalloprotease [Thermoplasmata archaeon]